MEYESKWSQKNLEEVFVTFTSIEQTELGNEWTPTMSLVSPLVLLNIVPIPFRSFSIECRFWNKQYEEGNKNARKDGDETECPFVGSIVINGKCGITIAQLSRLKGSA